MPVSRLSLALLLSGVFATGPALAADRPEHACLDKAEQRIAVATHRAVPLAQIIKSWRAQGHHGELVRARLCRHEDKLAYMLTLLGRSGKVVRTTVDAATGEVINGR